MTEHKLNDSSSRLSAMAMEVAADPGSPKYPELATALVEAGRYAEAVEICRQGLAVAPAALPRRVLAEALLLLLDTQGARSTAEQLLAEDPNDARALRILGACLLESGEHGPAREVLERSAALDPSDMRTLDLLSGLSDEVPAEVSLHAPPEPKMSTSDQQWNDPARPFDLDFPREEPGPPPSQAAPDDLFGVPGSLDLGTPDTSDPFADLGTPDTSDPFADLGTSPAVSSLEDLPPDSEPNEEPTWGEPKDISADAGESPGYDEADFSLDLPPLAQPPPHAEHQPPAAPDLGSDPFADPSGERPATPSGAVSFDAARTSPGPRNVSEARPSDSSEAPVAEVRSRPTPASRVMTARPSAKKKTPAEMSPIARKLAKAKLYLVGGGGLVLVAALLVTVFSVKSKRDEEAFLTSMAEAEKLMVLDTALGYREASLHLAAALDRRPSDPAALGMAALAAVILHTEFDEGIEAALAAEDYLAIAEPQQYLAPEAAAARGILNLLESRPADAVSAVTRSLGDHPGHPALLWVRARAEELLDREDMAIESLRLARSRDPSFLPAATTLADMLMSAESYEEAVSVRLDVLARNPGHLTSLTALIEDARENRADPAQVLEAILATESGWAQLPGEARCPLYLGMARVAVLAGDASVASSAEDHARALEAATDCQADLGRHLMARYRPLEAHRALSLAGAAQDPEKRREAAHAALAGGRPDWAAEILSSSRAPEDGALLALALQRQGRSQEAMAAAEAAAAAGAGSDAWAAGAMARFWLVEGDEGAARGLIARARPAVTETWEAVYLGTAMLGIGDTRSASRLFQGALREEDYPHYELLVLSARSAAGTGREAVALRQLERAITLNPEAEPAMEVYLDLAPVDRAVRFFSSLSDVCSGPLTGLAYLQAKDIDRARATSQSAGAEQSGIWARLLEARIEPRRDAAGLRALVTSEPARMMPRVWLADQLLETGRVAEAQEILLEGIRRSPGHPAALSRLAEAIALASNNPLEAVEGARQIQRRLASQPLSRDARARVHGAVAMACASAGDGRCARQAAVSARRTSPRDGRTLLLVGRALELIGDTRGARAAYNAASSEPGAEEALLRLGLLASGRDGEALLRSFLEAAPSHALAPMARQSLSGPR